MPNDRVEGVPDQRRLAALEGAGFRGPVWNRFAEDLADYGFQVMVAWIQTGQVFARMQERSRRLRLKPPSDGRTLAGEDADELACETVARALPAFQRVLEQEGWSAAGGASLRTYFIGQCLFCFPNVYRRWLGETRPPPWPLVQIDDVTETDYRYRQRGGGDPAASAETRLELEGTARRLREDFGEDSANLILFVVNKRDEGWTYAEIDELLLAKPRTAERLMGRLRTWQKTVCHA